MTATDPHVERDDLRLPPHHVRTHGEIEPFHRRQRGAIRSAVVIAGLLAFGGGILAANAARPDLSPGQEMAAGPADSPLLAIPGSGEVGSVAGERLMPLSVPVTTIRPPRLRPTGTNTAQTGPTDGADSRADQEQFDQERVAGRDSGVSQESVVFSTPITVRPTPVLDARSRASTVAPTTFPRSGLTSSDSSLVSRDRTPEVVTTTAAPVSPTSPLTRSELPVPAPPDPIAVTTPTTSAPTTIPPTTAPTTPPPTTAVAPPDLDPGPASLAPRAAEPESTPAPTTTTTTSAPPTTVAPVEIPDPVVVVDQPVDPAPEPAPVTPVTEPAPEPISEPDPAPPFEPAEEEVEPIEEPEPEAPAAEPEAVSEATPPEEPSEPAEATEPASAEPIEDNPGEGDGEAENS